MNLPPPGLARYCVLRDALMCDPDGSLSFYGAAMLVALVGTIIFIAWKELS